MMGGKEWGALSVQWDIQYPFLPSPHPMRNNELGLDDFLSATDPMSELYMGRTQNRRVQVFSRITSLGSQTLKVILGKGLG